MTAGGEAAVRSGPYAGVFAQSRNGKLVLRFSGFDLCHTYIWYLAGCPCACPYARVAACACFGLVGVG